MCSGTHFTRVWGESVLLTHVGKELARVMKAGEALMAQVRNFAASMDTDTAHVCLMGRGAQGLLL